MSGVISRPPTESERAAELEAEDLIAVGEGRRSVQRMRALVDEDYQRYLSAMRAAGRVDEEDTGVHHLDAGLERRAFLRRLAEAGMPEHPAETSKPAKPRTLRPGEIKARLSGGRDEHVVVLDRDAAIVTEIRKVLESEGYKVRSAENGIDGLARVLRGPNRPDVLFIDMRLPELNGQGVLNALLETDEATMPYVVLVDGEPCARPEGVESSVDHVHRQHLDPAAILRAARVKIGARRSATGG